MAFSFRSTSKSNQLSNFTWDTLRPVLIPPPPRQQSYLQKPSFEFIFKKCKCSCFANSCPYHFLLSTHSYPNLFGIHKTNTVNLLSTYYLSCTVLSPVAGILIQPSQRLQESGCNHQAISHRGKMKSTNKFQAPKSLLLVIYLETRTVTHKLVGRYRSSSM